MVGVLGWGVFGGGGLWRVGISTFGVCGERLGEDDEDQSP